MSESPEQLLEQQKRNCVFCKIVAGEIASRKVFENERFLAVLDINPAAPGHILLLPKEHFPILPLLPEQQQREIFQLAASLGEAAKEAVIAQRVTVFSASGYAAGQQAPHLLLHIIPREQGDGLEMLDLEQRTTSQPDALALSSLFEKAVLQMLEHLGRAPAPPSAPSAPEAPPDAASEGSSETAEFEDSRAALEAVLASNPDLRKLIMAQPSLVEDYVEKSPKLRRLFEGVNIKALSIALNRQEEARKDAAGERRKAARDLTEEELFRFIDGNEGLRTWLLQHPQELAANINANPRLQAFFEGVDLMDLSRRYREHAERGA